MTNLRARVNGKVPATIAPANLLFLPKKKLEKPVIQRPPLIPLQDPKLRKTLSIRLNLQLAYFVREQGLLWDVMTGMWGVVMPKYPVPDGAFDKKCLLVLKTYEIDGTSQKGKGKGKAEEELGKEEDDADGEFEWEDGYDKEDEDKYAVKSVGNKRAYHEADSIERD